jgi:DGQHR domain-containing protein
MRKKNENVLERKALRVEQKQGRCVYLMSLTGKELLQLAGVSRVSRDDGGKLIGYQRTEVRKHVREIADYLESDDMLLAHPIILSFSSRVRFISSRGRKTSDGLASAGMLRIPVPQSPDEKPAWIVDGQQRALAISHCKDKSFPVPICAFVADDVELQRDQFLRINNTKPLPEDW